MQTIWRHHSVLLLLTIAVMLSWLPAVTQALATAKKKKAKPSGTASTRKGFGVQPPTFAQVLAGFKTRIPEGAVTKPCPCGLLPGTTYADCCQPYHKGERTAESPLRVLQSRYSAFYYRVIPYVMLTTHPTCQYWRKDPVKWAQELDRDGTFDTFDFLGLTVVGNDDDDETLSDDDKQAHVEFRVRVRSKKDGEETILKEKSLFLKEGDRWFYASGEARPEPVLKAQD